MTDPFDAWLADAEARHLADLRFAEVSRALRAVSATYVERRQRLAEGAVLAGAGKRAAFSLFYAPLHYLTVREIVRALRESAPDASSPSTIVDLGCGTGVGGAAWAAACAPTPRLIGVDRHPWAAAEAARTYRHFGLSARTVTGDLAAAALPPGRIGVIAAFALNELSDASRDTLVPRLVERMRDGGQLLIVEPLAGFVAPWWRRWRDVIETAGGRADEWRFRLPLPPIVAKLDRAVGLDHRELTARTLALGFPLGAPAPR